MSNATTAIVSVLLALVGLAALSAVISNRANTANVIKAGGNAFSGALATAVGPVTGYAPSNFGI